jgi:hypothetical protein
MNSGKSFVKVLLLVTAMGACWYIFLKENPVSDTDSMTAHTSPQDASRVKAPARSPITPAKVMDTVRLRMYADTLGRAYGCGYRPEEELARVRNWLDTSLTPGSREHQANFNEFLEAMKNSAEQQREGKSSYSCPEVEASMKTVSWP